MSLREEEERERDGASARVEDELPEIRVVLEEKLDETVKGGQNPQGLEKGDAGHEGAGRAMPASQNSWAR